MAVAQRFAEFITDLQRLERLSLPGEATKILDAFTRHTPFRNGAIYLRDGRDAAMRLAAKSQHFVAPEIFDSAPGESSQVLVPLRSNREDFGMLALACGTRDEASDEDRVLVRAAADFL